jgi:biopolymer transport protein ExbB
MARHGSAKSAWFGLVGLLLLVTALAVPVVAQEPGAALGDSAAAAPAAPAPLPTAPMPSSNAIEQIMAATDSLAFGKAPSDSASLVPVVVPRERSLGEVIAESKFGRSPLGRLFVTGGLFMWILAVVAIFGLFTILDRVWTLRRAQVNTRRLVGTVLTTLKSEGVQAAAEECQKWRGPVAAVLYSGLQRADKGGEAVDKAINTAGMIEMSFLERRLVSVSSLVTLAPLIGILGTVVGMTRAFNALGGTEHVSGKVVAAGISGALVTTVVGLVLAVPAVLAYNYFVKQIDRLTLEMEEAAVALTDALRNR